MKNDRKSHYPKTLCFQAMIIIKYTTYRKNKVKFIQT